MKQEFVSVNPQHPEAGKANEQEKLAYAAPELKEHGSVEEVTLQTFFGSFSP